MRPVISALLVLSILCTTGFLIAQEKQEDYNAQLLTVTPSPLPQSPVVLRIGSDPRDERFKGDVKTLLEEKEYLDNTDYSPDRHNQRKREFGKGGNIVSEVFYDYRGNPYFTVAYGYLDGKRVYGESKDPVYEAFEAGRSYRIYYIFNTGNMIVSAETSECAPFGFDGSRARILKLFTAFRLSRKWMQETTLCVLCRFA
jgi:hypothetical protein